MLRTNWIAIVFAVFIFICFTGCTIIGYAGGSKADEENAIFYPGSKDKLAEITDSTLLAIKQRNKPVMTGTIQGINKIDSSAYLQRYIAFQSDPRHDKIFPAINDTITLVKGTRHKHLADNTPYLFSGFDFAAIRCRLLADNGIKSLNLPDLFYISGQHDQKFYPHKFRLYLEKGLVPLASELTVQSPVGRETI
jgi:hypothetical protein